MMTEHDPMDRACPYCGVVLDKRPVRRMKCPHCRETIYLKHRCCDYSRPKELMTEEEAERVDAQWGEHRAEDYWRRMVDGFEPQFEAERKRMPGAPAKVIAKNTLAAILASDASAFDKKGAAGYMARLRKLEGGDPMPFVRSRLRYEAQEVAENWHPDPVFVRLIGPDDDRWPAKCRKHARYNYRPDEIGRLADVPCGPECKCWLETVFPDEIAGVDNEDAEEEPDGYSLPWAVLIPVALLVVVAWIFF